MSDGASVRHLSRATNLTSPAVQVPLDQMHVKWAALGDSYTAAPGLHSGVFRGLDVDYKCSRSLDAYPTVLHTEVNFPWRVRINEMAFVACTGYTVVQTRDITLRTLTDTYDFMVMTVGGNDINFVTIAKDCLGIGIDWRRSKCDKALNVSDAILESAEFRDNMESLYDQIFAQKLNPDPYSQLYHMFYPRFFNVEPGSEWCDKKRFVYPIGPTVVEYYRVKLNDLVDRLNAKLEEIARNYIIAHTHEWGGATRLVTIDLERYPYWFEGHRFCEKKDKRNLLSDNVNFFGYMGHDNWSPPSDTNNNNTSTPASPGIDSNATLRDFELSDDDATSDVSGSPLNSTVSKFEWKPEWLKRSFHPKTKGHLQMYWALHAALLANKQWDPNSLSGQGGNATSTFSIGNTADVSTS